MTWSRSRLGVLLAGTALADTASASAHVTVVEELKGADWTFVRFFATASVGQLCWNAHSGLKNSIPHRSENILISK